MPFCSRVSKRDPTRAQSDTYARWSWGNGAATTLRPLRRVAARYGRDDIRLQYSSSSSLVLLLPPSTLASWT
jgi:hypothetical protein